FAKLSKVGDVRGYINLLEVFVEDDEAGGLLGAIRKPGDGLVFARVAGEEFGDYFFSVIGSARGKRRSRDFLAPIANHERDIARIGRGISRRCAEVNLFAQRYVGGAGAQRELLGRKKIAPSPQPQDHLIPKAVEQCVGSFDLCVETPTPEPIDANAQDLARACLSMDRWGG